MLEDRIFEFLCPLRDFVHQREVIVHDSVEERVNERADRISERTVGHLPPRKRLLDVLRVSPMDRDEIIPAYEKVNCLNHDAPAGLVQSGLVEDDEVVGLTPGFTALWRNFLFLVLGPVGMEEHGVFVRVYLGPLVGSGRILDGQRVEAELIPEQVDLGFVGVLDIQPHDGIGRAERVADGLRRKGLRELAAPTDGER